MAARRKSSWMCPALLLIVMSVVINTASSQQFGGGSSGIRRTGRDSCPRVSLKNGKVKLRSNGRVVKYSCNRDYVLVGESTSTCLLGEWTSESPVCATKGCPSIPSPPSGRFVASNGGAVLRLECNPGYTPSGSPMIYCVDRFDWNGTAPICQASGVRQSATRCDFESDDLCGWVQDTTTDEFDWTWRNYATPSSHLSTGPSFDHTLGQGKAGHYLFIESSDPRILNDTARLFSPVYGAPEASTVAQGVCFAFWFHMYGSTTGHLNVYIKPESKKWSELKPAWTRSGDQGNQWRQGYIPLDSVTENFQVVIEGVRGTGYVGDSAIDDVQLTQGEECMAALGRMMADTIVPGSKTTEPPSTVPSNASCSTRCSSRSGPVDNTTDNGWTCGCSDDCLLKNSCCIDYAAFCLTGGRSNTTTTTTTSSTTSTTTTTNRPKQITTMTSLSVTSPATTSPSLTTTTTASSTLSSTTTAMSTTSANLVTTSATWTVNSTPSTVTSSPTTTSTRPSSSTPRPTSSTSTSTSTTTRPNSSTPRPTTLTSTTTTTKLPTTTSTRPTTTTLASSTTTTERKSPSSTTSMTTSSVLPIASSTSALVTGNPQDGLQGDDQSRMSDESSSSSGGGPSSSSPPWLIGGLAAGAAGALLLIMAVVLVVIRTRRVKSVLGGSRRAGQQDQLAEDSDVRYLRDEDDVQLDLTEATPSSVDGRHQQQRQFSDFERL